MNGQLSIFEFLDDKRRITPITNKKINVLGNLIHIKKGEVYEVVVEHVDMISIRIYNAFGGSFGFPITYEQMKNNFINLIYQNGDNLCI